MNTPGTDFHRGNAKVDAAAIQPFPNSRKVYVPGSRAELRVPMREIAQGDSPAGSANPPIWVYDTSGPFTEPLMLFNLRDDIGETTNLAAKHPDKVKELDALIDRFLADTAAVVPKPNPAYNPTAAAMERWVNRGCDAAIQDGILKLQLQGPNAFIANASFRHDGPAVLRLRYRAKAPGKGKLQWRTADQQTFQEGHSVPFALPAGDDWAEAEARLPVKGTLIHLRLYPGVGKGTVEIDWLRLARPDGTVTKAWQFGR